MRLLAVDTTGPVLSLALADGERLLTRRAGCRAVDERLFPEVRRLLARAGLALRDLDAVAAASGPGRFTGIRVGLTYASLLGKALGRPAAGVSLFEAVALRPAVETAARGRTLCVALPGLAGELYLQCFRAGRPAGKPVWLGKGMALGSPLGRGSRPGFLAVGPAAAEAAALLHNSGRACPLADDPEALRPPSAGDLVEPARRLLARGRLPPIQPLYLKPAGYERSRQ